MPRNTRKAMVGKIEDIERQERRRAYRALQCELRRQQWLQRDGESQADRKLWKTSTHS